MTSAFSTLFASSPVLVCTTAAWRIFVVVCAPTPSAFPVVPDAEPWTFEPPPSMPGDTPVAALPLVFATPNPMLMTSATCTMSTWLPSSALTNAAWDDLVRRAHACRVRVAL